MCGSCKQFKPTFVELGTLPPTSRPHANANAACGTHLLLVRYCTRLNNKFIAPAGKFTTVKAGAVNIDDEKGMALAIQLGVLDGGIPYIGLFGAKAKAHSPGSGRVPVMVGAPQPLGQLETTMKELLAKMGA